MKTASRIASAALALAAIVSMSFVQPTHAQGGAPYDIEVTKHSYDAQGAGWMQDGPKWIHSLYEVQNIGGVRSPNLLVYTSCKYNGKWEAAKPVYSIPSLSSGKTDVVFFRCYKQAGKGWPEASKVQVVAPGELNKDLHNNSDTIKFDGSEGPIIVG